MNDSLNVTKNLDGFNTMTTFYSRKSHARESELGKSRFQRVLANSFLSQTQDAQSLSNSTGYHFRPPTFGQPTSAKSKTPTGQALEKLKTLSIRVNFNNKYNLFRTEKEPARLVDFLPPAQWKEQAPLQPRDVILKRLLSVEDFSLRRFGWYLSNHFKETHLRVSDVIAELEGTSSEGKVPRNTWVATKQQLMNALIPDNRALRACLLSKSRSTGSYKDDISRQTRMTVAQVFRQNFQISN